MFIGSIVAIITPMDDKGHIDHASLKKIIDYHVASGTTAIVSVGTTGESATLSYHEHNDVIMTTVELAAGRIPIIGGTGANSTAEAITLTKSFENSGIIGCLSVTPYYNRPTQDGLYKHFKAIAENTQLPQIIYNVPSRTGCDILPETVSRLSEIKNIVAIKEATGNLSRVNQLKELVNENFSLISGDDATALDFMLLGGQGVISVTANIAAQEMVTLCHLVEQGKINEARLLNQKLMYLHNALFCESNPIPIKWAAKELGLITNDNLRLPLTKLSKIMQPIVKQALIKSALT